MPPSKGALRNRARGSEIERGAGLETTHHGDHVGKNGPVEFRGLV